MLKNEYHKKNKAYYNVKDNLNVSILMKICYESAFVTHVIYKNKGIDYRLLPIII